MIQRNKRPIKIMIRWYHLTSYLLYFFTLLTTTSLIARLDRGLNSLNLNLIFLLVSIISLLFSLLKKPHPILLALVWLGGSIAATYTIVGGLLPNMLRFGQVGGSYLLERIIYAFSTAEEKILPDPAVAQQVWQLLAQAVAALSTRLQVWLQALPNPAYDPVALNIVWGIAVWLAAGWFFWIGIQKKQAILGILPPLLISARVYQVTERGLWGIFFLTGISILLAVLARQSSQEDEWEEKKLIISRNLRKDVTQYALWLSVGLVFFAGLASSPKIDDWIEEARERRRAAQAGDTVGSGDKPADIEAEEILFGPEEVLNETAFGALPNVHLLGSPPELAETEVFRAEIFEPGRQYASNYYFRTATYENYTRVGWRTSGKDFLFAEPEQEFEIQTTLNERLISQRVTFVEYSPNGNLMMTVGELAAADVPHYLSYHTKFINNSYTDLFAAVTTNNQYIAYSISPYYGAQDLRFATTNYPTWITNKYLQVPDSVPDRVIDLALSLTATQPTQYDRALAIESYLRGFEYTLDLAPPPSFEDVIDYFLFDLQKGYCDYFASAMVILARAAGIPARLATGYLVSTYDPELDIFIATADQAHAWVEIYFPEYGWVTFEPTAGQPALERQEIRETLPELETALDEQNPLENNANQPFSLRPNNFFMLSFQAVFLFGLLLAAYHLIDRWILAALPDRRMYTVLYRRLRRHSRRLGIRTPDANTPIEYIAAIHTSFNRLNNNPTFKRYFNTIPESAKKVITACSQAAYSKQMPAAEEKQTLLTVWGWLRWRMILAWLFLRLLQPFATRVRSFWYRMQQPA